MSSGSVGRRGLEGLLFIIVRQKWRASALSRFAGYRFCVLSMQPRALANNDRANSFSREEAQENSVRKVRSSIFDLVPDRDCWMKSHAFLSGLEWDPSYPKMWDSKK